MCRPMYHDPEGEDCIEQAYRDANRRCLENDDGGPFEKSPD